MFSWSKKNDSKKKSKRHSSSGGPALNEFGIPVSQGPADEELEAELRALTGGVITLEEDLELNDEGSDVEAEFMKLIGQTKGKKKFSRSEKEGKSNNKHELEENYDDVGVMNMKDEEDLDDEDIDVDENDPDLLGELMDLTETNEENEDEEEEPSSEEKEESEKKEVTVTSLLMERLNMYKAAEAKAKENKESSRARRFARGIKTLEQLIKKAKAGQPVLPSEIPPAVATNLKPGPPAEPVTQPPETAAKEDIENIETHDEKPTQKTDETDYLPPTENMENLTINDTSDHGESNTEDLISERPPPQEKPVQDTIIREPPVEIEESPWVAMLRSRREEYKASALKAKKENDLEFALQQVRCVKKLNELIEAVERGEDIDERDIPPSLVREPVRKTVEVVTPLKFEAPDDVPEEFEVPTTVMEALHQRLRIYKNFEEEAERSGDELGLKKNSKIVQVYVEAIKLHKAGKKVPLDKLPTPPGCPPIPIPFEVD